MKSLSRPILLLLLAVLLLGAAGRVRASGPLRVDAEISLEAYWNLLDHSRQVVDGLKGKSDEAVRAGLDELILEWEPVKQVSLENGDVLPLDNSFLLSVLRAKTPDLKNLSALFSTLLASRDLQASAQFTAENLQPLKTILARPEFQWREESNPIQDWFQKLWDRFAAWLDKLFPDREVDVTVDMGGGGLSIWTILAIFLLVLILAYIFRGFIADLVTEARIGANGAAGDEILTAESAFARAQSLSRGGDHRSAVRYLYLSALLLLDERGLLRYDRTRTNREVLRTVSDKPELAQPLSEVVDVFDNVWYGYHEVDDTQFKHYSDRVEELKDKRQ